MQRHESQTHPNYEYGTAKKVQIVPVVFKIYIQLAAKLATVRFTKKKLEYKNRENECDEQFFWYHEKLIRLTCLASSVINEKIQ